MTICNDPYNPTPANPKVMSKIKACGQMKLRLLWTVTFRGKTTKTRIFLNYLKPLIIEDSDKLFDVFLTAVLLTTLQWLPVVRVFDAHREHCVAFRFDPHLSRMTFDVNFSPKVNRVREVMLLCSPIPKGFHWARRTPNLVNSGKGAG